MASRRWSLERAIIDGVRLAYVDVGHGEPCLLLHGYPQSHRCWRHQIEPLAATRRRIVVPDWFGWGQSERSLARSCCYDDEVGRIGLFLDHLGISAANLVAHDYGGFIGLGFLVRYPQRVLRLAILNSRAHSTFSPRWRRIFGNASRAARTPLSSALLRHAPLGRWHRYHLRRYVRRGCFDVDELQRYTGWLDDAAGREWLLHFYATYDVRPRAELAAGLRSIDSPVAVIWGDQDPYCPFSIAEQLATAIPRARLLRLEGAGHYVPEERPADVLAALRALLAADPARAIAM